MKFLRPAACILAVMLVFPLTGCKVVSKIFNAAKKEVAQEVVEEGVKHAAGAAVGDNQAKSSRSATPSAGKSNLAKAGGAMVAGSAAAGVAAASEAANSNQGTKEAVNTLVGYYHNIAAGKMSAAYNSLTWEMQNQLGTYESFSQSYNTTVSNDVSNIKIISETPSQVVLSYQLNSQDKINGRISNQVFLGKATLSKSEGRWLIGEFEVKVK